MIDAIHSEDMAIASEEFAQFTTDLFLDTLTSFEHSY